MVATMTWLSEMGSRVVTGIGLNRSLASDTNKQNHHYFRQKNPSTLGILAFETAKTMSRIVSLYKSLSEDEFLKFRMEVMRSEGVAYLNSKDEEFLLKLAFSERIEDLDRAASAVARLGKKCSNPGLNQFEYVYVDMKLGFIDLGKSDILSKKIENIVEKMEKFISATADLYSGSEVLAEMELSERKLKMWKMNHRGLASAPKTNSDLFDQKLTWQRQRVRHLREVSLWGQTFDKTVSLMARTVCTVYARICVVFGSHISILPRASSRHARFSSLQYLQFNCHNSPAHESPPRDIPEKYVISLKSGSIPKLPTKPGLVRFWNQESELLCWENFGFGVGGFEGIKKTTGLMQQAPPSTVGGSGLALRYANVIILVERYLNSPCLISNYERENLYQMLPASLKSSVRSKLKQLLRDGDEPRWWDDNSVAEGWRDSLKGILEWLTPMAHDTVRWQMERNIEKQNFDAKPTVLLLQTLFFADREKTEVAIAQVLVGLSCICRCDIHRSNGP